MKCSGGHEIVEDKTKVIVDGAKVMCSYAQNPMIKDTSYVYLRIPCGHGFLENGHLCAHDQTCVPVENIPRFKTCSSPHYEAMLVFLQAWKQEGTILYQAYLDYSKGVREGLPCLLPLLDRWMNAKDKSVIENYMDLSLNMDFNSIEKSIKIFKKQTANKADEILLVKTMDTPAFTRDEKLIKKDRDAINECQKVKKTLDNIIKTKNLIHENLQDDMFYVQNVNLQHIKKHLLTILAELTSLKTDVVAAHSLAPNDSAQFNKLKSSLKEGISEVNGLYDQVCSFKPERHQIITMDSYLVCRGGGILSFLSSGQEYYAYCNDLVIKIRNLTSLFKNNCEDRLLRNRRKYLDYIGIGTDEEGYSYKKAIRSLETYKKMLDDVGGVKGIKMETPVYLELISHAYFEERRNKMMSLVTIAVTWFGTPGMTLFFGALQVGQAMADGDLVSGMSGRVSIDSAGSKVIEPVYKNAYTHNNLFSTATAMVDFFAQSQDTWIEEIKLSVFCSNARELSDWAPEGECDFLHTAYCLLNQDGSIRKEGVYDVQKRKEFIINGGVWDYTPAASLVVKEHFGDNQTTKMNEVNDITKELKPEQNKR
ncbi:PAAR-like protein [Clostridium boliviensis]